MFTGIIEQCGKIVNINTTSNSTQITIRMETLFEDIKPGDSIAVNGVCLTIVVIQSNQFIADVSPETLKRSTLSMYKIGSVVNLERALKMSDRLGGHIVSGHIDGTAIIESKKEEKNSIVFAFTMSDQLLKYIALKGSVAVDGISLTVADCTESIFKVSIIPYTLSHTTLLSKSPGDYVNIECDILCKYIERLLFFNKSEKKETTLTMNFLKDTGFI